MNLNLNLSLKTKSLKFIEKQIEFEFIPALVALRPKGVLFLFCGAISPGENCRSRPLSDGPNILYIAFSFPYACLGRVDGTVKL